MLEPHAAEQLVEKIGILCINNVNPVLHSGGVLTCERHRCLPLWFWSRVYAVYLRGQQGCGRGLLSRIGLGFPFAEKSQISATQ